uniref:Glycine-rich RNA-binding protein 2, mitochondrial n=2 Tax=Anthurium amnicola TaxID=1678845 RepID=A0A1D1Y5Y0_9ARAE
MVIFFLPFWFSRGCRVLGREGGMRSLRVGNVPLAVPLRAGSRLFSGDASKKLFVGGLSYDTNESTLKDTFRPHGEVIEVNVICNRVTGKSKGFGFVKFTSASEASRALQQMDGQLLDGRNIRVEHANKG